MNDALAFSSTEGFTPPVRQKRILPSRSRRGGPGVGNCDADNLILDTFKRQSENEPLIPKDTMFYMTTHPALAPPEASSSSLPINSGGYERYFEKPDVIKAYREQQLIETPEFWSTAEGGENVVSRFRPRPVEGQAADTSDEVYMQRHRKYEKFEKRQRLREKEKLQHEQYKLHERVIQLRVMDSSAFLTLPASSFLPRPADEQHNDSTSSQLLNGSSIAEGERRRKEMLAVAEQLEERYKTLLPPRPWRKVAEGDPDQDSDSPAVLPPEEVKPEIEEEEAEEDEEALPQRPHFKLKLSFSKGQSLGESSSSKRARAPRKEKKSKQERSPSSSKPTDTPRMIESSLPVSAPSPMHPDIAVLAVPDSEDIDVHELVQMAETEDTRMEVDDDEPRPSHTRKPPAGKVKVGGHPKKSKLQPVETLVDELATTPEPPPSHPPHKRRRKTITVPAEEPNAFVPEKEEGSSMPPPEPHSISAPIPRRSISRIPPRVTKKECTLVLAAQNYEIGGTRTKRQRHNLAWGFKIPPDVTDMEMDFELPLWLLHDESFQLRYSRYIDFDEDPKFAQQMNPLFKLGPRYVGGQRLPTPEHEVLAKALNSSHREHGEDSQSESEEEQEERKEEEDKADDEKEEEKEDGNDEEARDEVNGKDDERQDKSNENHKDGMEIGNGEDDVTVEPEVGSGKDNDIDVKMSVGEKERREEVGSNGQKEVKFAAGRKENNAKKAKGPIRKNGKSTRKAKVVDQDEMSVDEKEVESEDE